MDPIPRLLRVSVAARLIGVSVDTLKRYEKAGLICASRTPTGHRRFRREDVERLRTSMEPAEPTAAS